MIRLYRLKDRQVREVDENDSPVVLRCLKRAGFVVGELPPAPKPKEPIVEKPLPPTEGEDVEGAEEGEPVLAKHAPVGVPLQEVKGAEAETDAADVPPTADAVDEEATEELLSEMSMKGLRAVAEGYDLIVPSEIKSKVALAAFIEEQTTPAPIVEDEPEGKDEGGEVDGTDEPPEESEEDDG